MGCVASATPQQRGAFPLVFPRSPAPAWERPSGRSAARGRIRADSGRSRSEPQSGRAPVPTRERGNEKLLVLQSACLQPLVIVSSKFNSTLAITVHAASSAGSRSFGGSDRPAFARAFAAAGSFFYFSRLSRSSVAATP